MKLLLLIIGALLLVMVVGSYTNYDNGQIMIGVAGWTIHTSFNFFLLALIIAFYLSHLLFNLLSYLFTLPKHLHSWRQYRKSRVAEKHLSHGLMQLLANNWRTAEKAFVNGISYSCAPLVNYLAAAKAAQMQHDDTKIDAYLLKAEAEDENAKQMIGIVKAELQIQQQQTEQALETLTTLYGAKPKQAQVQRMLLYLYAELHEWQAMLDLLAIVKHGKFLSRKQIQEQQLQAYAGLLRQAGLDIKTQVHNPQTLTDLWSKVPRRLCAQPALLAVYVEEKLHVSDTEDCEPLLRHALKKHQDSQLIHLYGLIENKQIEKQLKFAESLLPKYTQNARFLLMLGRISSKIELFGKARQYLQESLDIEPLAETYQALGTLLDRIGESKMATVHYKKGLALATVSLHASSGVE